MRSLEWGMLKTGITFLLGLSVLVAGCASAPPKPYWEDLHWINALATTVHSDVQYPEAAAKENFPSGSAVVVFLYAQGRLLAPRIVKSTGSPILDAAIIKQIPNIKPPRAMGQDSGVPHAFQMNIGMYPYDIVLFREIRQTLADHIQYPITAGWDRPAGRVVAEFHFKNGKVFDPKISISSGYMSIDHSVLRELQTTPLPKPPAWLKDKTFIFSLAYCFGPGQCANTFTTVRYVPAGEFTGAATAPCAEVGYRYRDGSISNIHLIKSSGDTQLDKRALAEATAGKLAHPPALFDRATSDYSVPICNNRSPNTVSVNPK